MKFVAKIELLLIALWLGAACFFSLGVAPSAFAILPSRELAGGIVSRTLTILNFSGLIISIILLLSSFIPRGEAKSVWLWIQRGLFALVGIACAFGQIIIGYFIERLRWQMGRPIDELAVDDPLRVSFAWWHQTSVWVLVAAIVFALAAFFIVSRTPSRTGHAPKNDGMPDFDLPDELKM